MPPPVGDRAHHQRVVQAVHVGGQTGEPPGGQLAGQTEHRLGREGSARRRQAFTVCRTHRGDDGGDGHSRRHVRGARVGGEDGARVGGEDGARVGGEDGARVGDGSNGGNVVDADGLLTDLEGRDDRMLQTVSSLI